MKVAAYCRVSTDKNDQINSLQNQLHYFTTYIQTQVGWELVEVFADEGTTGTSTKHRVAFHRMIQMAKNKDIDLIITKEVSRFARNTIDTLTYTRQLKALGIGILFINDNINTLDNEGEFRLTIMASVAQEESRKISERVKWGQRRRMEQGVVFGNNSILGYTLQGGSLQIDAPQARIVQDIFYKYVDEGKGARIIAKELNQAGIRPVYAKHWSSESILKILKNEKYTGDLLQRKTYTPDFLNHSKRPNDNPDDLIYLRDNHEPIISRSKWNKAQELLRSRQCLSKSMQSKPSSVHWCSGKVICGLCGSHFIASKSQSSHGYVQTWLCSTRKKHGGQHSSEDGELLGCDNPRIQNDILLFCVRRALSLIQIPATEMKEEVLEEIKNLRILGKEPERNLLQKQLLTLKNRKDALILSYLDNILTQEEFLNAKSSMDQTIARLNENLQQREEAELVELKQHQGAVELSAAIDGILSDKQAPEAFFAQLVERILIYPHSVRVCFYELPFCFEVSFRISRAKHQYQALITESKILPHPFKEEGNSIEKTP